MAIPGNEFVNKTPEEILELYQATKCIECGVALHESTTGTRMIAGGCVCSDCYFQLFAAELDVHPICTPGTRRGA